MCKGKILRIYPKLKINVVFRDFGGLIHFVGLGDHVTRQSWLIYSAVVRA